MTRAVRTTTAAGESIVILAAEDYDQLVAAAEDARDGAIADRALADCRSGQAEALTADYMRGSWPLRLRSPFGAGGAI
jgi:hypothetical protein